MLHRLRRYLRRRGLTLRDHVSYRGTILPPRDRRFCGPQFKSDAFYVASAEAEARRLVEHFGCTGRSRVLDVGSGQGRLPVGLLRVIGDLDYLGLDVDLRSVAWCQKHIQERHPSFRFRHLDIANDRYHPRGAALDVGFRFPLPDRSVDIVYLFSVFSHMYQDHMCIYLNDFRRILADQGDLFVTAFVEEGVPACSVNPQGYVFAECSGPLHLVRYERSHFFGLLRDHGFEVAEFTHRTEVDGQSALYLRRRGDR